MALTFRAPTPSAIGADKGTATATPLPVVPLTTYISGTPTLHPNNPSTVPTTGQLWPRGGFQ